MQGPRQFSYNLGRGACSSPLSSLASCTQVILASHWLTVTILTPDWLVSTRRRGSVQQEGGSAGEVRAHGLRKVRSEAGHLSPTYTEDTGPGRGGDVVL